VRGLKNQRLRTPLEVAVDLPWEAYLPRDYVPSQRLRIEVYRRLARVRRLERLEEFRGELRDRFGPLPEPAEWLLRLAEVRLLATRWQVAAVSLERPAGGGLGPTDLVLGYRSPRLVKRLAERGGGRLRVVDESNAYFRLAAAETEPAALYERLRGLLRADA
jgi:transcription-repair coupling factor (superfamily II helicase)